jgi:hypothetical protein
LQIKLGSECRVLETLKPIFVPSNVRGVKNEVCSAKKLTLKSVKSLDQIPFSVLFFKNPPTQHKQRVQGIDDL